MSEDHLQADCYQWAWNTFPDTRRLLFSIPNGGTRNTREAMKLKATGLTAGVADLLFLWNGKTFAFELKVGSNKQSENQKLWEMTATPHIEKYYLITKFEDFKYHFTQIVYGTKS
jgi:hypothetical protein